MTTREAANIWQDDFVYVDGTLWMVLYIDAYADTRRMNFYLSDEEDNERLYRCDFTTQIEVL